jgi:hypothetical protein
MASAYSKYGQTVTSYMWKVTPIMNFHDSFTDSHYTVCSFILGM